MNHSGEYRNCTTCGAKVTTCANCMMNAVLDKSPSDNTLIDGHSNEIVSMVHALQNSVLELRGEFLADRDLAAKRYVDMSTLVYDAITDKTAYTTADTTADTNSHLDKISQLFEGIKTAFDQIADSAQSNKEANSKVLALATETHMRVTDNMINIQDMSEILKEFKERVDAEPDSSDVGDDAGDTCEELERVLADTKNASVNTDKLIGMNAELMTLLREINTQLTETSSYARVQRATTLAIQDTAAKTHSIVSGTHAAVGDFRRTCDQSYINLVAELKDGIGNARDQNTIRYLTQQLRLATQSVDRLKDENASLEKKISLMEAENSRRLLRQLEALGKE